MDTVSSSNTSSRNTFQKLIFQTCWFVLQWIRFLCYFPSLIWQSIEVMFQKFHIKVEVGNQGYVFIDMLQYRDFKMYAREFDSNSHSTLHQGLLNPNHTLYILQVEHEGKIVVVRRKCQSHLSFDPRSISKECTTAFLLPTQTIQKMRRYRSSTHSSSTNVNFLVKTASGRHSVGFQYLLPIFRLISFPSLISVLGASMVSMQNFCLVISR